VRESAQQQRQRRRRAPPRPGRGGRRRAVDHSRERRSSRGPLRRARAQRRGGRSARTAAGAGSATTFGVGVAPARNARGVEERAQLRDLVRAQRDPGRRRVLTQVGHPLRPRDRHDVERLSQQPRQRDLTGVPRTCRVPIIPGPRRQPRSMRVATDVPKELHRGTTRRPGTPCHCSTGHRQAGDLVTRRGTGTASA
jgi:hypothetical protein